MFSSKKLRWNCNFMTIKAVCDLPFIKRTCFEKISVSLIDLFVNKNKFNVTFAFKVE